MTLLVIGVGNAWRGDDAAGLAVARRVAAAAPPGVRVVLSDRDQSDLAHAWCADDRVIVVDAAAGGARAGGIHRFDAAAHPLPRGSTRSSTHAFGVGEAIELARALGSLPRSLTVYAIEGADFAPGAAMTPAVARAARRLAAQIAGSGAGATVLAPDASGDRLTYGGMKADLGCG